MLNTKCFKFAIAATSIFIGTALSSMSMAAEEGPVNYPAGSPGVFIGEFPPIPGLFMVSQTSYTSSDALYDANGDEEKNLNWDMSVWVETLRFLASYPGELWGARLYSQLVVPIVLNIDNSLSVSTPFGPHTIFDDSDSGLGNLTVTPLLMNWVFPESHQYLSAGLDIALEAGASYDQSSHVNPGTGYNTFIPTVVYRYDNPDGFDIGARLSLLLNLENDSTNYKTGDMVTVDFTAGWNFGKWKVGIVGGYTDQYELDEDNGVTVDDSEMRSLVMGPSIAYSAGPIMINLNYQKGLLAENTSMNDALWLNFTLPLYVPESYRPKH